MRNKKWGLSRINEFTYSCVLEDREKIEQIAYTWPYFERQSKLD